VSDPGIGWVISGSDDRLGDLISDRLGFRLRFGINQGIHINPAAFFPILIVEPKIYNRTIAQVLSLGDPLYLT